MANQRTCTHCNLHLNQRTSSGYSSRRRGTCDGKLTIPTCGFGVRTSLEAHNRLSCPRSADTAFKILNLNQRACHFRHQLIKRCKATKSDSVFCCAQWCAGESNAMTPHSNYKDPVGEQQSQPTCMTHWLNSWWEISEAHSTKRLPTVQDHPQTNKFTADSTQLCKRQASVLQARVCCSKHHKKCMHSMFCGLSVWLKQS